MRVREVSAPMRWSVLLALSSATALIYIVSLRGNYLYGLSLGQTPEKRELFAWANVAADIWKGFGLVAVMMLWRDQKRVASIGFLAWWLCLATGVNSAIAIYVLDRTAVTDKRAGERATYDDVARELAAIETRLAARSTHRIAVQIDAAIARVLARPVIVNERVRGTVASLSHSCAKHDSRTVNACAEVAALREERAAAEEHGRLERDATDLRVRQLQMRDAGSASTPDPVGEFWAWATRGLVSVRDVGFGFPLLFALLIETVSAFGPAVIVAIAAAPRSSLQHAAAGMSRRDPAAAAAQPAGIMHWLGENTEPSTDVVGTALRDLYENYAAWCGKKGTIVCDEQRFANELDRVCELPEIADKIRKTSDRYYGLRLASVEHRRASHA